MPEAAQDLHNGIDGFLTHAGLERRLAPNTITAYARDLARLCDFLVHRGVRSLGDL